MNSNNKHVREWLDPKGASDVYGFSVSRQHILRKEKGMPYHQIGRYIRYDRFEVDEWLSQYKMA